MLVHLYWTLRDDYKKTNHFRPLHSAFYKTVGVISLMCGWSCWRNNIWSITFHSWSSAPHHAWQRSTMWNKCFQTAKHAKHVGQDGLEEQSFQMLTQTMHLSIPSKKKNAFAASASPDLWRTNMQPCLLLNRNFLLSVQTLKKNTHLHKNPVLCCFALIYNWCCHQVPVRCWRKKHLGISNPLCSKAVNFLWGTVSCAITSYNCIRISLPHLRLNHFPFCLFSSSRQWWGKAFSGEKYNDYMLRHWSAYWAISSGFIDSDIQTPHIDFYCCS